MGKIKLGLIICDRYKTCLSGKCFRALKNREGAFEIYQNDEVELVAYTTCGGCPGGNIEYAPEEMIKNGVSHIHFATGFLVDYPPCPYMDYFNKFISERYGLTVVLGTQPIPQKYFIKHQKLNSWNTDLLNKTIQGVLYDETTRLDYD